MSLPAPILRRMEQKPTILYTEWVSIHGFHRIPCMVPAFSSCRIGRYTAQVCVSDPSGCGEDRHPARAPRKESFELHDATEPLIRCTRRRFEPGDPATLSNGPPREKLVEVLKAPLAVKFLIQRVVQLTGIDVPGLVI